MDQLRNLAASDIPHAMELCRLAGWNQVPEDWQRLLDLDADGCFCVEVDRRVVATATLLTYGTDLGWVGMVLTHPEHQRRGYARQLVEATLQYADERGIGCVKLDATDQGRPLYLSLGFQDEQPIERWLRAPAPLQPDQVPQGAPDLQLDRRAFGADRSAFLHRLGPVIGDEHGFGTARLGSRANYLGPIVARTPAAAERLARALIAPLAAEPWFVDVLPSNGNAVTIFETFGFRPVRHLVRMFRGEPLRGDDTMVYAIAGFEAG